ncbi:MAG: ankyrin repeat domain-containing protein [Sideroxydans sp.]|nr:ankyrin repeat domain-containing protein [Sideroxydans sp.]
MNPTLLRMLDGNEAVYPHVLEARFPRVFSKLLELWETPRIDAYLQDLLLNTRGGDREGFPPEAAKEIFRLSSYHSEIHVQDKELDVWGGVDADKKRKVIMQSGYEVTTKSFLKAVEDGNLEVAKRLIDFGANLEVRDERNWTALIIASAKGSDDVVKMLLESGAKTDVRDMKGYSALHWAAYNGHGNVAKLLLDHGVNPNQQCKVGWTPLMLAAARGHLVASAYLIAFGGDVNQVSEDGSVALHRACQNGHLAVVKLLIEKGADRQARQKDGSSPLNLASKFGHSEIVALLCQTD